MAKQRRDLKDSPGEPRAPKGGHENAKKTPEDPKRCQKTAGGFPKSIKKATNMKQKLKKRERQNYDVFFYFKVIRTAFFKIELSCR